MNVFNIYSINLLRFSFNSPSTGGIVLRKMMESLHPFDFSWCDSPWALFTSSRGWQKTDGTALSPFSKAWFPCIESLVALFGYEWIRVVCLLSFASCWCFLLRLAHMGWVVCTCCHGLLLVNIFGFFINICNRPLGN